MKCKKCGYDVGTYSITCKNCGEVINNSPSIACEISTPMKWYNTLVHSLIWVWIGLGTIVSIANISKDISTYYNSSLLKFFTDPNTGLFHFAACVFPIVSYILLYIIRKKLKCFSKTAFKYMLFFLLINVLSQLFTLLGLSLAFGFGRAILNMVPSLVFTYLFYILNFIYFQKRKHLFVN